MANLPPEQKAMLISVLQMTKEQIDQLPPKERGDIVQLVLISVCVLVDRIDWTAFRELLLGHQYKSLQECDTTYDYACAGTLSSRL